MADLQADLHKALSFTGALYRTVAHTCFSKRQVKTNFYWMRGPSSAWWSGMVSVRVSVRRRARFEAAEADAAAEFGLRQHTPTTTVSFNTEASVNVYAVYSI